MGDVTALRGDTVQSDARQAFLDSLACSFDKYVADHGAEPQAMVYTLGGLTQPYNPGWLIRGESERGVHACMARAATLFLRMT